MPSLDYLAGFFDGEGWISMSKRPSGTHRLTIGINCTYQPILRQFHEQFGGHLRHASSSARKQMYTWELRSIGDCLQFLRDIEPRLIEKRPQAVLGIQWLEHRQRFPLKSVKAQYDMAWANSVYERLYSLKHMTP